MKLNERFAGYVWRQVSGRRENVPLFALPRLRGSGLLAPGRAHGFVASEVLR